MTLPQVVEAIVSDAMAKAILVLIVLDLVLGVAEAVKSGSFHFAKVAGFLRDDVLGKAVPWAALYSAWKFAPDVSVIGVDLEIVTRAAGALLVAALAGSLVSSLAGLGLSVPSPLKHGENPPTG
jgi:uncharacterized membrane protein